MEFLVAGASAVQIGTANFLRSHGVGPHRRAITDALAKLGPAASRKSWAPCR